MTTNRSKKPEGEPVGIALLGFGTVGAEVFRLVQENADAFAHRIGGPVEIRGVAVHNKNKLRPGVPKELLTDDAKALVLRDVHRRHAAPSDASADAVPAVDKPPDEGVGLLIGRHVRILWRTA